MKHRLALHRFAVGTAGATFLLLIAGALVTSNDAGLAVPDWPLSYGTWMPPMVGNIVYEHGHRMVASFVGLLTIILALWLWRREPRHWVRRLGWLALGAVTLQGVLGGVTVLFLLPRPVSIAHASLAQLFFCLTVSLAVFTGPSWNKEAPKTLDTERPTLRRLAELTTVALFGQLLLGAALRHDAVGVLPHVVGALVVAFFAVWTLRRAWKVPRLPELRQPAAAMGLLLVVQLGLGVGAYVARLAEAEAPQPTFSFVALSATHLAVGALLLASSLVLTLRCHRRLQGPGEAVCLTSTPQEAAS